MVAIFSNPTFTVADDDGSPLAGGKVFFYIAGTSTKQNTWTDSSGAVLNTNPVVLDARGEASVWLDPTLFYKIVVARSDDTDPPTSPIWSRDGVGSLGASSSAPFPSNLYFGSNGPRVGTPSANRLAFYTDATVNERVAINPAGFVSVGGARDIGSGDLQGSGNLRVFARVAGGISLTTYDTQDYTATQFVRDVAGTPTQVGTITCTSVATSYNTSSDERLKVNIAPAGEAGSLIDTIQVRAFDWRETNEHQAYGFVAQELSQVFPSAVHVPADPAEMQSVDPSKLVPALVREIQSLRTRVAALEARP